MLFTSVSFLYYFLPVVLILYFALPKKCKNFVLFVSSLFFYFYGEPKYIILMLAEILIAYIGGLLINKFKSSNIEENSKPNKKAKIVCIVTVSIHILLLCIFKYTDFLIGNVNSIFGANLQLLRIALPIGISFYTFQILSYVIDVYNGKVAVQKSFLRLATYVMLFPQLIAGPIVRYETVEEEMSNRKTTFEDFSYGVRRFIIGLGKKVLIANMLGELCEKFNATGEKSVLFYWMFAISYMLQLYFDFSAYSDMAIGLGRVFGFHFLENFNYPYISKSITEFWRRWHISLSSWFRDYVYIPLGGNRKGMKKQIRNIFVVWLLTGIWHGASWNFIVWGLMFGVLLIIEKFFLGKKLEKLPSIFQRMYVLFIVMISFVIFNASTMSEALRNIGGLFGINVATLSNKYTLYCLKNYIVTIVLAVIGATPFLKNLIEKLRKNNVVNKIINLLEPVFIVAILFIVTAYLVDNSYNPFLYFRF